MPVTVVVGGQFGSEGKGKVAHALAKDMRAAAAIRVGGTNSGHTVVSETGARHVFRQLPTAALLPECISVIPAGAYVDPNVLLKEASVTRLTSERLVIDPNAFVVTDADAMTENQSGLKDRIGSTLTGTGAAVIRRVWRADCESLASA